MGCVVKLMHHLDRIAAFILVFGVLVHLLVFVNLCSGWMVPK